MKLAVIFPGIGYHTDKPLLYYSKKIAAKAGYEIREIKYGTLSKDAKGSAESLEKAFVTVVRQSEKLLKDVDFTLYDDILFISKSIGTAAAAKYAEKHYITTRNVYFTPVAQSFLFMEHPGIVFHGTADKWVSTNEVKSGCENLGLPLYITENANHSLETGNLEEDLRNLAVIMKHTEDYINQFAD